MLGEIRLLHNFRKMQGCIVHIIFANSVILLTGERFRYGVNTL